jgi:hypothetical protein
MAAEPKATKKGRAVARRANVAPRRAEFSKKAKKAGNVAGQWVSDRIH